MAVILLLTILGSGATPLQAETEAAAKLGPNGSEKLGPNGSEKLGPNGSEKLGPNGPMVGIELGSGLWQKTFASEIKGSRIRVQTFAKQWLLPSPVILRAYKGSILVSGRSFDEPIRLQAEEGALDYDGLTLEGNIECWPEDSLGWTILERLPMERYLPGVVAKEVSASSFAPAALRAQAIAARTYALYHTLIRPDQRRHVYATTRSQVYGGSKDIPIEVKEAVEATRGQVLMTDGQVFESFFHSTCGGVTCSGETYFNLTPMAALSSVNCGECHKAKYYRWQLQLPEAVLRDAVSRVASRYGIEVGKIRKVTPAEVSKSGFVSYLEVRHDKGSLEISTRQLRGSLSSLETPVRLRSTAFDVIAVEGGFLFRGRGYGHGVGMCQMGAKGHAANGKDHDEILRHYYRDTEIRKLW